MPAQALDLLHWIRAFADRGNSVVLITHKLSEALSVADDITVLRHGKVVLRASVNAVRGRGFVPCRAAKGGNAIFHSTGDTQ